MKTLYFITSNKGKLKEAKASFSDLDTDIVQKNLGYPEIQADNLEEVAIFGVNFIKKNFEKPFILEDAGLFINEFNGFPGVYSAYVFYKIGCSGILRLMEDVEENRRNAIFKSVYVYSEPGEKPIIFLGECKGKISNNIKGEYGFGYDPIFIPDKETKTFGEMDTKEKNNYSHRGKSLKKLKEFLKNRR
jgi:XTP/dITP diphosphohydrolase